MFLVETQNIGFGKNTTHILMKGCKCTIEDL